MRLVAGILLACLGACGPPPSGAQVGRTRAAEQVVSVAVEPIALAPGGEATLELEVRVEPGFHIQSHAPSKPSYIPTEVALEPKGHLTPGRVTFPKAHAFQLDDETIEVYDGVFEVEVVVRAGASAEPGDYVLDGRVRYQACDDAHCLFPREEPFAARIRVVRAAP